MRKITGGEETVDLLIREIRTEQVPYQQMLLIIFPSKAMVPIRLLLVMYHKMEVFSLMMLH